MLGHKATPMMRAFLEVGDDTFIPLDQVASDPSLCQAAIQQLKREIFALGEAEKNVAKNTLEYLRRTLPCTPIHKQIVSAVRQVLAATAFQSATFSVRQTIVAAVVRASSVLGKIHNMIVGASASCFGKICETISGASAFLVGQIQQTIASAANESASLLGRIRWRISLSQSHDCRRQRSRPSLPAEDFAGKE